MAAFDVWRDIIVRLVRRSCDRPGGFGVFTMEARNGW